MQAHVVSLRFTVIRISNDVLNFALKTQLNKESPDIDGINDNVLPLWLLGHCLSKKKLNI